MSRRKSVDRSTVLAYGLYALFFIALVTVVFLIRLWITGGDIGCVFSRDPALCVVVKDIR